MISFSKYVDIQSGVAGATQVPNRLFGGRVFTTNPLFPSGGITSFTDDEDVGTYAGEASVEFARAQKYFAYKSPSNRSPQVLQFAKWNETAMSAQIYGGTPENLAFLKTIIAGTLTLLLGGTPVTINAVNLSAVNALADVAAAVQAALVAEGNVNLETCTVVYDPIAARFVFTASPSQTTTLAIGTQQAGAGVTDLGAALGWYASSTPAAIFAPAGPAQTMLQAVIASIAGNGNFGSFLFDSPADSLADVVSVALQNKTYNVQFQYHIQVTPENYQAYQAALAGIGSCSLTYELDSLNEFPEQIPMQILGATDFTAVNGVDGYMYRQDGTTTASVTDDPTSDTLDALAVNYYGETEVNGQPLSFYQTGVLMGLATDPLDMNVHANEQWLKSNAGASIMNLQLAVSGIGSGTSGKALLTGLFLNDNTGVIPQALNNGTIEVGKELDIDQQQFITEATNDPLAWQQVQNIGYWFNLVINQVNVNGRNQAQAQYLLIYSKDDLVRSVQGVHSLI